MKEITATIHGITVNEIPDEKLEEQMESHGCDTVEEFEEKAAESAKKGLARHFDNSLELLEVVCEVTDAS